MLSAILNKIRIKRKLKLIHHGQNACVAPDVTVHYGNNIWIGDNSYINPGAVIIAGRESKIQIGNNCLISYNAHLRTSAHNYLKKDMLIREQGMTEKDIVIEDDCWVGFGAQIMAGVTMKQGSVLAAGAILTHDTVPYGVYAGVPARKIKKFSAHMSNIEDHVLKDKSCAEILIGFIRKMDEETILQSAGRDRSFLCAQQCRNSCWGLWAYPLCVLGFFWEGQQVIRKSEFSTDKEIRFRKTSKPCRSKSTRFKAFFSFRREYWICLISSCSGYSPPVVEWSVSRPEQVYCLIYSVSSSY